MLVRVRRQSRGTTGMALEKPQRRLGLQTHRPWLSVVTAHVGEQQHQRVPPPRLHLDLHTQHLLLYRIQVATSTLRMKKVLMDPRLTQGPRVALPLTDISDFCLRLSLM